MRRTPPSQFSLQLTLQSLRFNLAIKKPTEVGLVK